jgi:hypothetical protein
MVGGARRILTSANMSPDWDMASTAGRNDADTIPRRTANPADDWRTLARL